MTTEPTDWVFPSPTWEEAIERYVHFLGLPAWWAGGEERASGEAEPRGKKLSKQLARLRETCAGWPSGPGQLVQDHVQWLFPKADHDGAAPNPPRDTAAGDFWAMCILDRGGYECCWCGRQAFRMYVEENRTLRLELDHQDPRASGGVTLMLANIRPACRSCNTLRGRLPTDKMQRELRSLAKAVMRRAESE